MRVAWNKGKHLSQEIKDKLSLSHKGKLLGDANPAKRDDVREKLRQKKLGENNPRYGKPNWNTGKKLPEMSGKNHWAWIDDRTKLAKRQERNDSAYHEWRIQVWKRDGFKCKINNEDCNGPLRAHHILGWKLYPELRYNINNGITLCQAHHPKKRAEEKRLIPFLQGLVSVSNTLI